MTQNEFDKRLAEGLSQEDHKILVELKRRSEKRKTQIRKIQKTSSTWKKEL